MLNLERKEAKALVISILVVSFAFSLQKFSFIFLIQTLILVSISLFTRVLTQVFAARSEGIDTKYDLWPLGLVFTAVSALLSNGLAVIAVPLTSISKERETERWKKSQTEMYAKDVALGPVAGVLGNLGLAGLFLILLETFGGAVFRLGAMINFWFAISQLIPYPPFEGRKIIVWDVIFWSMLVLAPAVGLIGLLLV